MLYALSLALAAIAGATVLTYADDRAGIFWARLGAGVCVGLAALGVIGFALASFIGMTPLALLLSGALVGSPLLLLRRDAWRSRVATDVRRSFNFLREAVTRPGWPTAVLAFYFVTAAALWFVCDRAMFADDRGIFTGFDTNIGDLPFHLAVITSFADGGNFPPQHPEMAGVALTYHFIADFVTAMFVRAGATLPGAFFWQNFAVLLALAGLLHYWAWRLTRDRLAALLTLPLVFLSGGFGWFIFLQDAARGGGIFDLIGNLPRDYTIGLPGFRWGNAVTALFVPQRGLLLGVALVFLVWILWLHASDNESNAAEAGSASPPPSAGFSFLLTPFAPRPLLAAGLMTGLLPLVHSHSFAVTLGIGGCLALWQMCAAFTTAGRTGDGRPPRATTRAVGLKDIWRPWAVYFLAAIIVGAPQMWWAAHGSAVQAGKFFAWHAGWDRGAESIVWFWLKNTGFFIPLLVAALAWRAPEQLVPARVRYFYLPFTLCFILPNLFQLSPWLWDNIKILFFWWVASAPLVALLLSRLWRRGEAAARVAAALLLIGQTAAGGLDVWRAASGTVEHQTFNRDALRFTELIRRVTPPHALILHAPTYNDPVYLTGRRTFLGYPGHLWAHGLDYAGREDELKRIYAGAPEAEGLIMKNNIEYIVIGPLEEAEMNNRQVELNRVFFERYSKVGEEGEYRLYKTTQP